MSTDDPLGFGFTDAPSPAAAVPAPAAATDERPARSRSALRARTAVLFSRLEEMGLTQAIGAKDADADVLTDVDSAAAALAVEVRLLHAKVLSLRDEVALATQRVTLLEKVAALQERRGPCTPIPRAGHRPKH